MKTWVVWISLMVFGLRAGAESAATPSWGILKVGSTYTDESPSKRQISEIGTGTLVDMGANRWAVLTAAHLIRGQSPWVEINGRKKFFASRNLLFDADHDIALIEIDRPQGLAPVLSSSSAMSWLRLNPALRTGAEATPLALGRDIHLVFAHFMTSYSQLDKAKGRESFWVIQTPWAQKRTAAGPKAPGDNNFRRDPPQLVSLGDQIRVKFAARPGLSGTIGIQEHDSNHEFGGVLVQYNSFFKDAYFASPKVVNQLVRSFYAGQRGANSGTEWFMKNGLTFRRYAEGYEEAFFINRPSGNGVYADPGNGVYTDPGNGVYTDPGNGVYTDPGNGVYTDPGNGVYADPGNGVYTDPGNGVYTDPGNGIYTDPGNGVYTDPGSGSRPAAVPALSLDEVMRKYGLDIGMRFNGKRVVGIRAVPLQKTRWPFVLYANPQAITFMRKNIHSYSFYPVLAGDDLIDCLRDLVNLWFPRHRHQRALTLPGVEDFNGMRYRYTDGSLSVDEKSIKIHVMSTKAAHLHELLPKFLENGFRFELDRKGRLKGNKTFSPIIDAKDPETGLQFRVDLRGLFFIDLTNLSSGDIYNLPKESKSDSQVLETPQFLTLPVRANGRRFEIEQLYWDK